MDHKGSKGSSATRTNRTREPSIRDSIDMVTENDRQFSELMTLISIEFLNMLSDHMGGETTVNELRVMSCIRGFYFDDVAVSHTLIRKHTKISGSTITRSITNLLRKGWIEEMADPKDRRRRTIVISQKVIDHMTTLGSEMPDTWKLLGLPASK